MEILLLIALVTTGGSYVYTRLFSHVTIYEFQKGLLYHKGKWIKTLMAGRYRVFKPYSTVEIIDMRRKFMTLPGQEILTKDNINIKITMAAFYEIADVIKMKHCTESFATEFYNKSQLVLREVLSQKTLDDILEHQQEIDTQLLEHIQSIADELGLKVATLAIKDVMLPANLKRAYSGILEAQKESQRLLEKARGEQAVLRNLANSSGMYERNPMLMQARLVQAVSSGNNTIVFQANGDHSIIEQKTATKAKKS